MFKIILGIALVYACLNIIIGLGVYGIFLLLFGLIIFKPSFWIELIKSIFDVLFKVLINVGAIILCIPMLIISLLKKDKENK